MVTRPETVRAVLAASGGQALAAGHKLLDHDALRKTCEATGMSYDEWFGALSELQAAGHLRVRDYDGRVAGLKLTGPGLWTYLTRARSDLADVTERLLDRLDGVEANVAVPLGEELGESPLLVEGILDHLLGRRLVVYSRVGRDSFRIHRFCM
jgi:hypothetical protein